MARKTPTYQDSRRTAGDVRMGQSMAALRVSAGLTQTELAERLEDLTGQAWTQVMVSYFETSRRLMTVSQAAAVAYALDVSLAYLARPVTEAADSGFPWAEPLPDMPRTEYPVERVAR